MTGEIPDIEATKEAKHYLDDVNMII